MGKVPMVLQVSILIVFHNITQKYVTWLDKCQSNTQHFCQSSLLHLSIPRQHICCWRVPRLILITTLAQYITSIIDHSKHYNWYFEARLHSESYMKPGHSNFDTLSQSAYSANSVETTFVSPTILLRMDKSNSTFSSAMLPLRKVYTYLHYTFSSVTINLVFETQLKKCFWLWAVVTSNLYHKYNRKL